jgi:hypothetical protein
VRNLPLRHPDGEILFAVGAIDLQTIRDLCVEALVKDPKNIRILRVLRGVSPYDKALPPSKRKRLPP